jgi:hypothetical protein
MKLTLTLMLVAVLAFSLPLIGCKKENTAPSNATMNMAPADNTAPAANVPAATTPATTTPAKTPTATTGPA